MAKDGTNRGGARIGAGAKKKPLADKIAEGNPGKRALTVISFDDRAAELEGQAMPKPSKMLSVFKRTAKRWSPRTSTRRHGSGWPSEAASLWYLHSFWSATP